MENKTKVKVAIVIGIVILAIIFIFMVVFVKGNRPKVNKNIPKGYNGESSKTSSNTSQNSTNTTGDENEVSEDSDNPSETAALKNIVSLGITNGSLVEIDSNLKETLVRKMEDNYSSFCYGDGKVYVLSTNENGSIKIVEIDLQTTDFTEKTILESSDYGIISNLEYYSGKLYFVSQLNQLIEYSISENYVNALSNGNEVSSFVIDKKNNNMIVSYKPNGENPGIYIYDFTSNSFNQIIALDDFAGKLFLNGTTLVIDVISGNSFYVYDMTNQTVNSIGTDNNLNDPSMQIDFYNNMILYTDGTKIDIKKANGESSQDNWYTLNDSSIAGISMIDSSKLQIERYDSEGKQNGITRSVLIDLKDGTTTEVPDKVYLDLIRIGE